jgi:hypothetical protein
VARPFLHFPTPTLTHHPHPPPPPPCSVALWICGFCGNSNPSCPYRPTRSGGYRIFVPEGPMAQRYPGYEDVAAPGIGPDLRDMCQQAGFMPADTS